MIVIEILLGLIALWQLLSIVVLGINNLEGYGDSGNFGRASIGFILAIGFLGVLLK